jgi:hypothetical protein
MIQGELLLGKFSGSWSAVTGVFAPFSRIVLISSSGSRFCLLAVVISERFTASDWAPRRDWLPKVIFRKMTGSRSDCSAKVGIGGEVGHLTLCLINMSSNNFINNDHRLSCRCGSSLPLDVLSLNRKLLGDQSEKLYCLACMVDIFECAVEDVVSKLDAFKREGCRIFPAQAVSE